VVANSGGLMQKMRSASWRVNAARIPKLISMIERVRNEDLPGM